MNKKIFIKIVIAAFVVFVFDFTIGTTLRHFYFKQVAGSAFQNTYAMDSTKAEVLVFGSSRASHHYVPGIFEDSLKMSFYNVGRDGNFAVYSYAVFLAALKRYTPKIVILDITPGELNYNIKLYDRLSSLLPQYKKHPEIREIVELRSPYEKLKLLSAIYPFNSILIDIATGNFELKGRRETIIKGYIPIYNHLTNTSLGTIEDKKATLDSTMINALTAMANCCNQRNIRFVIVTSPLFARYTINYTDVYFKNFATTNHVEYLNMVNDSVFMTTPAFFQDHNHLNNDGAIVFSKKLVSKLKYLTDFK